MVDQSVAEPWLGYDEVFFDCDSTLTAIEGIEELARLKGAEHVVACMTEQAMEGEVPLEQIYSVRLQMLKPTREDLLYVANRYREAMMPDARELVATLHHIGRRVHVVSGGMAAPVLSFGSWLGIPIDCIHAVGLEFDQLTGRWWEYSHSDVNPAERYLDFVPGPLSESHGKHVLIREVRHSYGRALLVGDGVSDLLARPAVELFVGFGGAVRRERVVTGADVYIDSPSLAPVLPLAARAEDYDRCRGSAHQDLFDRGLDLISKGGVSFRHREREASFHACYKAVHSRAD